MSPRTRKIVYVLIGIYGTFETYFYARMLWGKFGPKPAGATAGDEEKKVEGEVE